MEQEEVLKLIEQLDGDEHSWVDYKSDYRINGNPHIEVEFLKDVLSLANAIHDDRERYVLIGCDEDDGIVGVSDDAFDDSADKRHILSFDEDDLQEKINGWMTPSPRVELHTYEEDGCTFALFIIHEPDNPPSISDSHFSHDGNSLIEEGEIWIRSSSGKDRATHEAIENIIQKRVKEEREFILEGVRRVVGMGPEAVADVGKLQPSEKAEADISFEISPDGDYQVSGEVFRRRFDSLQEEIDADIAKRDQTPNYTVDLQNLMRYYANLGSLDGDEEVAELLVYSSLTQWLQGTYWLMGASADTCKEILSKTPDDSVARHSACKSLLIAGERDLFDDFMENSDSIKHPRFNIPKYHSLFARDKVNRIDEIISSQNPVEIDGNDVDSTEQIEPDKAFELIPKTAREWLEASDDKEKKSYKYTLRNLELWLSADVL
ncbi:ATP-binding protein [Halobacteria archaeon HArc-gm2]|nr:ATP-binding protein [Halobacteria archaeon HArc-gm2]